MKLTSNEARTILENFRGTIQSDRWIDHCICVGDTAGKIAEALTKKGYDEEYCNICITHSYLNNDIICTAGGVPNPKDKPYIAEFVKTHKYTIEEKLINLCDLMCPQGGKVFTIDKRLIDIMIRRGAYPNTQYHVKETYKLKAYFDDLLGYNLYDLFPEIKNNL